MSEFEALPPSGEGLRVGIVASRFNREVTERLLAGARKALIERGVKEENIEVVRVPGAFEIPLAVELLARRGEVDAVVCVGAVIRGETPHFDYVAGAAVGEAARISVAHALPLGMGILTTNNVEQALVRSADNPGNKGYEAALAALEMAELRRRLQRPR